MTTVERLKAETSALDVAERRYLAAHLLSSLDEEQVQLVLDGMIEHDPDLLAELERRDRDHEAGLTKPIPWADVVAELRARKK